jgi:peptide subunit release factor 1 (eRF1)
MTKDNSRLEALETFYRSYKRIVNQCFNSNPSIDHGFLTHNHISCGSCGLTKTLRKHMDKVDALITKQKESPKDA